MIKPTIGRVVWFWPKGDKSATPKIQPLPALICHVINDTCVNLAAFWENGAPFGETSVELYQGEGERPKHRFCEWMPYQLGQAAKTQQPERDLTAERESTDANIAAAVDETSPSDDTTQAHEPSPL